MPGGNIFLNYRRDDTAGHAGRLFDRLNWRFPGRVFRDVTGIGLGLDFVQEVERKLADCQVLIVLIGKHWLTLTDDKGRRRLDNPRDLVRLEVAAGLRRNIRVIPVLVQGAQLPPAEELPPDLQPLPYRNALEVTEPDFENDVARLISAVEQVLGEQPLRHGPPPPPSAWKKVFAAALVGGLAVAAAVFLIIRGQDDDGPGRRRVPLANTSASPGPQPSAWANAGRTPATKFTPATKLTPTPAPSPDSEPEPDSSSGPEPDAFFEPVGVWHIASGPAAPYTADLTLGADNSFAAREQGPGFFRTIHGAWAYSENDRVLMLTGRDQWGNPIVHRIQILRIHEDHYDIVYPGQGTFKMWRR